MGTLMKHQKKKKKCTLYALEYDQFIYRTSRPIASSLRFSVSYQASTKIKTYLSTSRYSVKLETNENLNQELLYIVTSEINR